MDIRNVDIYISSVFMKKLLQKTKGGRGWKHEIEKPRTWERNRQLHSERWKEMHAWWTVKRGKSKSNPWSASLLQKTVQSPPKF